MRLKKITLRHFRNVGFAALEFSGRQQFLVGANGQGKTNLLEAAGFITALRSFRATDNKLLIGHGQPGAAIAAELEHEKQGDTNVMIKLRPAGKELWCDQARVTRLADHLGRFPTVVFSAQDLQLVRGAPALRRRWLDLTLAAMDAGYLRVLQTYGRALAERNSLLKRGGAGDSELSAFEQILAPAAAELIARRETGLREIGAGLKQAYAQLSDGAEPAGLGYEPDFADASAAALLARLERGRARDQQFRTTLTGPHRDDFHFSVHGTAAKDFASEGQQRALVLALRLAQAAWCREKSGVRPVLLADDVLGELDPARRQRFWSVIDPESQVIATGTTPPNAGLGPWQLFVVADGTFTEKPAGA
ncbi:MAG: DNA replication and repair protein RecF [Verrucomicrobia bacterium]|jgi:DNA replication and repair protein RecF|nr:MAG: DNA replication and repair protein RecF [Verrucomicrobiota bacterium]